MADSGGMHLLRRSGSGRRLTPLRALLLAVALVGAGCSSGGTDAAEPGLDDGPARLALEPGDDPAQAVDQLAVPPTTTAPTDLDAPPADALASTEGASPDDAPPSDAAGEVDEAEGAPTVEEQDGDEDLAPVVDDADALVSQLVAFVETERGHRFAQPPSIQWLPDAAFAAAVADLIAADAARFSAELDDQTRLQRALEILGPDQDLVSIQESFGDAGITALYDPNTGVISVRDEAISPLLRTSLVFELTRALDDQQFGIRGPEGVTAVAEVEWARAALVHGSAAEITNRYRATMSAADIAQEESQVAALPRNVSLSLFTDSFLELQFGRQFYGEAAVAGLWDVGQSAVDAALADPPESSEWLIAGAAADAPDAVATPPADAAPIAAGVWGQAGWIALFTGLFTPEEAEALTDGWGGDAWVLWEAGTQSCVRLHLTADSPEALDRYADALDQWAGEGDRQLFFPTADLIRVTACG